MHCDVLAMHVNIKSSDWLSSQYGETTVNEHNTWPV